MKKKDWILIAVLVIVVAAVSLFVLLSQKTGAYVLVRVDGNEVARYDLDDNGEYALNGGTNILKIENGKAYLTYADCPDHLCVKQGTIDKTGQTITCLPNRLTVTVFGAEGEAVDLIS